MNSSFFVRLTNTIWCNWWGLRISKEPDMYLKKRIWQATISKISFQELWGYRHLKPFQWGSQRSIFLVRLVGRYSHEWGPLSDKIIGWWFFDRFSTKKKLSKNCHPMFPPLSGPHAWLYLQTYRGKLELLIPYASQFINRCPLMLKKKCC